MSHIRFQYYGAHADSVDYLLLDKNQNIRRQNSGKHPRFAAVALTFIVDAAVCIFVSQQ